MVELFEGGNLLHVRPKVLPIFTELTFSLAPLIESPAKCGGGERPMLSCSCVWPWKDLHIVAALMVDTS